jgi:hypothetical protein
MILLVFDAHKLDISDEFRDLIQAISANTDKIRIVLNKAQEVDADHLIKASRLCSFFTAAAHTASVTSATVSSIIRCSGQTDLQLSASMRRSLARSNSHNAVCYVYILPWTTAPKT